MRKPQRGTIRRAPRTQVRSGNWGLLMEARRLAYLEAMGIDAWVPRQPLPHAAASSVAVIEYRHPAKAPAAPARPKVVSGAAVSARPNIVSLPTTEAAQAGVAEVMALLKQRPKNAPAPEQPVAVVTEAAEKVAPARPVPLLEKSAIPRFSLQLLKAGPCLLVVDLPTGEVFQRRDPAYLLLRDILRAAQLPDSPEDISAGEPIRWPLSWMAAISQGEAEARDYVQGVISVQQEQHQPRIVWLLGEQAVRFALPAQDELPLYQRVTTPFGPVLALPGLETLMETPTAKALFWQCLCTYLPDWTALNE